MDLERSRKIERLYEAALEVEPARRAAFLAEHCAGDESLRLEVGSLLLNDENAGHFPEVPALEMPPERARPVVMNEAERCPECGSRLSAGSAEGLCPRCLLTAALRQSAETAPENLPELGCQIGAYRIERLLGEGGMGVVCKAHDTRLGRSVALKFIKAQFSERFEREARAIAALNHPHIATLYEVGEHEGTPYLAMEFVEGRPLKGPRPVKEVIECGIQIADALAAAHAVGVVHRDLKPANILVTEKGSVKILDFGLAKLSARAGDAAPATATSAGVRAGTPGYMSPEQIDGKPVDSRSDIFAFGCVLYELASGRHAFEGDSVGKVLGATATTEPKPLEGVPPELDTLIHRCLRKDPEWRLQDAGDARIALQEMRDATEPGLRRGLRARWKVAALIGALIITLAVAFLVARRSISPPAANVLRTTIQLPPGEQLRRDAYDPVRTELALSPDGRYVVFSASPDGSEAGAQLWLRALDKAVAVPISGTDGARRPFFSPDGQWVAFFADGQLQKIRLGGGIPDSLCKLGNAGFLMGAAWGENGRIILGWRDGGLRIVDDGGKIDELTTVDKAREVSHRLPYFLPGGKAVLFTVMPLHFSTSGRIEVLQLDSGKRTLLLDDGMDARYVPTGHLVFLREGTLLAVPVDLHRLQVLGPPVAVAKGVQHAINERHTHLNSGAGQYSFSQSGTLVYASGEIIPDAEVELLWVDRQGRSEPVRSLGKRPLLTPRLSPDGQKLVFNSWGRKSSVWVHDLVRGTTTPLTSDEGRPSGVSWTPDGNHVVFGFKTVGFPHIFRKASDGSGSMELLGPEAQGLGFNVACVSRDRLIGFVVNDPKTNYDIWIHRMDTGRSSAVINSRSMEQWPAFSPDGRWLAFGSDESGRFEIYVTPVPSFGRRIPISNGGGVEPLWARNGRELFYWDLGTPKRKLMAVDIVTEPDFRAGSPNALFEFPYNVPGYASNYDVSLDGRRFLISGPETEIKPIEITQLNLVFNWFEELKRIRAPSPWYRRLLGLP